jgi:hypothetical protein
MSCYDANAIAILAVGEENVESVGGSRPSQPCCVQ